MGIKSLHPKIAPSLDVLEDLVRFAFADHGSNGRRRDHDLKRRNSARYIFAREDALRNDGLEGDAKLGTDLLLLGWREDINDAVNRLGRVYGMQRTEYQVARFRSRDGKLDRLQVPHLADQNHIRILSHDVLESVSKRMRVGSQLTLIDDGPLILMDILNGIFNRHHVAWHGLINVVDKRGEAGGLPASRRPGHQNEPARQECELLGDRREPKLFDRPYLIGDHTKDRANLAPLPIHIDSESRGSRYKVTQVKLFVMVNPFFLFVREDRKEKLVEVLARIGWVLGMDEVALNPHQWRDIRLKVEVTSIMREGVSKQIIYGLGHVLSQFFRHKVNEILLFFTLGIHFATI